MTDCVIFNSGRTILYLPKNKSYVFQISPLFLHFPFYPIFQLLRGGGHLLIIILASEGDRYCSLIECMYKKTETFLVPLTCA